ncbi:MAG: HPr kinase/phosphorylase [Parvibaculaceae bacterium]
MLDRPPSSDPSRLLMHATCVLVDGHGVLLLGASGGGKSDLALRLIDDAMRGGAPARLVADDQVCIRRQGEALIASPPPTLAGLMEVRGLGIIPVEHAANARLALVAELKSASGIERLPDLEMQSSEILGVALPKVEIDPALPSAPARLRAAVVYCAGREEPTE